MLEEFLKAAKDHYWDTCEPQKALILKHLEGIAKVMSKETVCTHCGNDAFRECMHGVFCTFCQVERKP